jgi:hypothetical protein
MKKWLLIIVLALFSTPILANDIYVTQSGDTLDLDITQDGANNVAGTSSTAISLTGDTMTFSISQVGDSNIVSTVINGNTYTGNINLTGDSNQVDLTCDSAGTNCETVSMSVDVTADSADITVTIGSTADAQNYVGTLDVTSSNTETITLTVNGTNADTDIDISNSALGSSTGNTANYTISGDGDVNGHSLTHSHTGEGATIDITQSGIYDNVIDLTTSGDNHDIDITQSD